MKQLHNTCLAALCAAAMAIGTLTALPARAEEDTSPVLPSGTTVQAFSRSLDDTIAGMQDMYDAVLPATAIGIFQGDEILLARWYGVLDKESMTPTPEDCVFEWGSISKTLIWVSAMQLWEQGQLDLERDVREYLPDGFFQRLSYDDPITMLDLMDHKPGWQETSRTIFPVGDEPVAPLKESLQSIEPMQVYRPGEVMAYSNYGAAVAAYVIECITGEPYCQYVHEHIFEPLGMEHTALAPEREDNEWVQQKRKEGHSMHTIMFTMVDEGLVDSIIPAYPAGAAAGTIQDLMTYAQALVDEDAPLFQSKETQAALFTPTVYCGTSDVPLCAHGFWPMEFGVRVWGHGGATMGATAEMELDLESQTGYVAMTLTRDTTWALTDAMAEVFGAMPADKYGTATQKTTLPGYWLPERSHQHGLLRFTHFFSSIKGDGLGELGVLPNDLLLVSDEETNTAMVLGTHTRADGTSVLETASCDMYRYRGFVPVMVLFMVYVLLAILGSYLLRIRLKLTRAKRWTPYKGQALDSAAHGAWLVSVLLVVLLYVFYADGYGGVTFRSGALIGILQMICAAVCAVAAIAAVIRLVTSKKDTRALFYSLSTTLGSVICIGAVAFFELYKFWGI